MEEDVERVRSFYTKRVEETQRKADCQIRALKRGSGFDAEPVIDDEIPFLSSVIEETIDHIDIYKNVDDINDNNSSNNNNNNDNNNSNNNSNNNRNNNINNKSNNNNNNSNNNHNNNNINDNNNNNINDDQNIEKKKSNDNYNINHTNQDKKETNQGNSVENREIQNLKNQYDVKLLTLQLELNSTNERLKALTINPTNLQVSPFIHDVRTAEIELLKLQFHKESENQKQIDREKWQTHVEERYERDRKDEKEKREYQDQKDDLRRRLKEEELKVEKLSSMTISLQNQLDGPKTPQMAQFMVIYLHR